MANTGPKPVFINNVVTPEGRLCYPHLENPSAAADGSPPKFGVELILPKTTDLSVLKAKVLECANLAFGPKVPVIKDGKKIGERDRTLKDFEHPFKDGDAKAQAMAEQDKDGSAYAGAIFLRARSKKRPQVIDRSKADIDPAAVYGGAYGRLVVSVMSYRSVTGNKPAVTFLLEIVQMTRDGEPLGGGGGGKVSRDVLPDDLPPVENGDLASGAPAESAEGESFLD